MEPIVEIISCYIPITPSRISRRQVWKAKAASAIKARINRPHRHEKIAQRIKAFGRPVISSPVLAQPTSIIVPVGCSSAQTDCPLFKLPAELRQHIYEFVFGPSIIHIESLGNRLAHIRCQKLDCHDDWDEHMHCGYGKHHGTVSIDQSADPNDQLLALSLTCRQTYLEAHSFLLSVPLFTVAHTSRVFVTDQWKFGTLMYIRNLSLQVAHADHPEIWFMHGNEVQMTAVWTQTCRALSALPYLRYLCIYIMADILEHTNTPEKINSLVNAMFDPLRMVKVARGGRYDVITQGWHVPFEIKEDLPFRVIREQPLGAKELAKQTMDLGEVSQSSYVKMASMPWPYAYRSHTRHAK